MTEKRSVIQDTARLRGLQQQEQTETAEQTLAKAAIQLRHQLLEGSISEDVANDMMLAWWTSAVERL